MGDQFKVSIEVKATTEQLHNVLTPWEKVRSEVIQALDVNTAKDTSLTSDSADTVKMLLTGESSEDFREEPVLPFVRCRITDTGDEEGEPESGANLPEADDNRGNRHRRKFGRCG